jgi:uncharacterized membrane protein YqaE (UPF0057 family)
MEIVRVRDEALSRLEEEQGAEGRGSGHPSIFLPPAAVFASGKAIQGIVNLCLYIMPWFGLFFFVIPGVLLWGIACAHAVTSW